MENQTAIDIDIWRLDELWAELDYLRWFKQHADFGPADSDVHMILNEQYTNDTGKDVPKGWQEG